MKKLPTQRTRKRAKSKRKAAARKRPPLYKQKEPEELKAELITLDPSKGYKSRRWFDQYGRELIEDLPFFHLYHATMMLFDPVVRFGLNVRDAALTAAKVEVECNQQEVRDFIGEQWKTIWGKYATTLLKTKRWGYAGFQIIYSQDNATGHLIVDDVKDFSPYDTRALLSGGRVVGFNLRNRNIVTKHRMNQSQILAPRGLWCTFDAEGGRNYGTSILRRSFGPWWEKWMDHGYKKTAQLRMMKDAARGDSFSYPPNMAISLPDGTQIPWRDVVRDIGESALNGATMVFPALYDREGHELVKYKPPTDTGNPVGIWEWGKILDRDIWRGCDVFEEVIQASASGSGYSGRSIPLIMFLQACMTEFLELMQAIDRDVLRPLAWMNFGGDPEYQIRPVPLAETFAELTQGSAMGGGAMGGPESEEQQPRGPGRERAGPFIDFRKKNGSIGQRRNPFFKGGAAQMSEWQPYQGPRGGQGWIKEGRIVYGEKPGDNGDGEEEEPAAIEEIPPGMHDFKLPSKKTRLELDTAREALEQMGFELGISQFDFATKRTLYPLKNAEGKVRTVSTKMLRDMIYEAQVK